MLNSIAKKILGALGGERAVEAYQAYRGQSREIVKGKLTYNEDGSATTHNCQFLDDPVFIKAYEHAEATRSWVNSTGEQRGVRKRVDTAISLAIYASHLPGDFVECGTNRGGLARAILHYVDLAKLGKKFYLLDTFKGFVQSQITPEERARGIGREEAYQECYDDVAETFKAFPNVKLVRGAVPDTLVHVPSERIAFLMLDMNCTAPEIAAAEYFWDRMSPGAPMLLDDYGFKGHEEQMRAFDEFAAKRGLRVLSLLSGPGIILKP